MNKRFLALLAALILCLGLMACGSGEKKEAEKSTKETEMTARKQWDFTDKPGMIHGDFADKSFYKGMEYQEDRTTCLAICGDSLTPGQEIRIVITVRWESDLSVSEEQMKNAAKSYEPARMLTEETLKKYGAEGCRISYQLGNDDMGSWSWNDVLTKQPHGAESSEGCIVWIESHFYPGDEELVTYQLDQIGFNWDVYQSLKK